MNIDQGQFLIEATNVCKIFPGVIALDHVDFDLKPGEVHVLLGENGAGKSTLIKIISGAYTMDSGEIKVDGKNTNIISTHHAIEMGIATCYQEFNLIPYLTVAENMYLGKFPKLMNGSLPMINKKKMQSEAQSIIDSMDIDLDAGALVNALGVAQQQMAEIAKAVSKNARIYIMDEPTAVLSSKEIDELFKLIKRLRDSGAGIVYISHRLEELPVIGDRVTVMRDGKKIKTIPIKGVQVKQLIEMMVGRKMGQTFPAMHTDFGKELLRTKHVTRKGVFDDINIQVREGEIIGIAGLVGSRRTEVVRAIFGADKLTDGQVFLEGKEMKFHDPKRAVQNGLSLLPEDRKQQGLVLMHSVKDNIALASMNKYCKSSIISEKKISESALSFIDRLGIKTPSINQRVENLSGGNQQKVVIAKWLASGCKVFMFDEPTRGIDVGAKAEVYNLMNNLVQNGCAIIMVSSEMGEIVNLCNRVYVMNHGRICAELSKEELNEERILKYALLGEHASEGAEMVF